MNVVLTWSAVDGTTGLLTGPSSETVGRLMGRPVKPTVVPKSVIGPLRGAIALAGALKQQNTLLELEQFMKAVARAVVVVEPRQHEPR